MITVRLQGGLGNQIFQVAAAYSLAKENNDVCKFDFYNGNFTQKPGHNYINNIFSKLKKVDLYQVKEHFIYNEPRFNYKKIDYTPNLILNGYFQSEKYFFNKEQIIDLFSDKSVLNFLKIKYRDKLQNSIAIHVRRGDYLNLQHVHPCQPIQYYLEGIKLIQEQFKIDNILIFSDDLNWCKKNFNDDRITFIEGLKDYEDLYLMSLCNHNIISNSSFSWWGSYLNLNGDKIVIAPKKWFGDSFGQDYNDIYYEGMVKL